MSFSNPLWNDMIIQYFSNIDNKLGEINTHIDNLSTRIDYIEQFLFNKVKIDDINKIKLDDAHFKEEKDEDSDDAGEWMKVNKKYKRRY
jgi:hypothetical protein